MMSEYTVAGLDNAYPASKWREVFCALESVVGRSVSEVLIEDLRSNGVDVSMGDAYVKVEDVRKVVDWLFGEGSGYSQIT